MMCIRLSFSKEALSGSMLDFRRVSQDRVSYRVKNKQIRQKKSTLSGFFL